MHLYTTTATLLLTLAFAPSVAAQDKPFVVTAAYPGSIGAVWQLRERVALRSEFTLGYTSETDSTTTGISVTTWRYGGTASALLSVIRDGPRHLYVGPYYEFRRHNTALSAFVSSSTDDFGPGFTLTNVPVDVRANEHSIELFVPHSSLCAGEDGVVVGEHHHPRAICAESPTACRISRRAPST